MKALPLHLVFAALLIGSVVSHAQNRDPMRSPEAIEPAIIRIAAMNGLAYRGVENVSGATVQALAFEAPGCARPLLVAPLLMSFEESLLLQFTGREGDSRRYVYIDRSWTRPQRFSVFFERAKYAALAMVHLTSAVPSGTMLLIDAPPECHAADAVDWRLAWNRDFLAGTAQAVMESTR